jgi:PKD repeat protein
MKNRLSCLLIAALWLFGISYARGQTISGRKTVCYGSTWNYTYVAPSRAGVIYTWTLSGTYGTVTGTGPSVNINWGHVGTVIFSCERDSAGVFIDRAFDTVIVVPQPAPYIVTTERIACQSFDTSKRVNPSPGPALLDDANGCPKLCAGSTATFIVRGIGTDHHSWQFSGGNVVTSTDSSITVAFDTVTTTSTITLIDTSAGGCIVTKAVCIQKIKPPHPSFTVDSLSHSTSSYSVCKNTKVLFKDLTPSDTSSSITDYHWDFGDGNTSDLKNPTHTYVSPKTYKVTLTVTNECGCSATSAATTITVNSNPGPKIYCPSVLCENDTATYSTDPVCTPGNYMWSVGSGGTILSTPPYGSSILVQWNGANADGYNTVNLWDNGCGTLCSEVTTVKIPLVQHSPTITGMNNLFCTHHPYPISIPLWPATEYNWGVIGHPNCVLSGRRTNAVALRFDTAGSYQVHVWFKNSLRLCGGDTTFTIQVSNPPVITGPHIVCNSAFGGASYSLSGGFTGTWTITGPLPNPPQVLYGSSCVPTFNIPGTYIISVAPSTGYPAFCSPDPYIVTVTQTPGAVDSVKGPTVVCSGLPYRYYAYSHEDGYIYKWVAKGGNIFDTPIGDSMTVHWVFAADTTVDTLQVYRVSIDSPYCSSNVSQVLVRLKTYHPWLGAPSDQCSDSYWYFDTHVPMDKDVKVRWTVMNTIGTAPSNGGTVVAGADSTYATILWNHVSGLFLVRAIINTCSLDTTIYEGISVDTQAVVKLLVAGSDTSCNGSLSNAFYIDGAGGGPGLYAWTWGDGTVDTTATADDAHTWNVPVNSGIVPMPVTVTSLSAGPGFCAGYAPGRITAYVRAPYTHVSTKNTIFYCDTATVYNDTLTVSSSNTGTVTGYTWVRNGSTISGSGSQIVVNDTGYYTVTIHTSACDFAADSVHITKGHCPSCANSLGITESQNCNTVTATGFVVGGGHATFPQWTTTGGGVIAHPADTSTTISYNTAGYYYLTYYATVGGCNINITQLDSVPLVAKFNVTTSCTTPNYTYNFTDNSSKLPAWTIASVSWDIKTVAGTHITSGTGSSYSYALATGSYIVTETVTTGGAGVNTCTAIDTINVTSPVALVTVHDSTTEGCDQVPMYFRPIITPSTAVISSYLWDYGDGTGSLLAAPQKGYLYGSGVFTPNTVRLTVTDAFGCIYHSAAIQDSTFPNTRGDGIINPYFYTCAGMADTLVADTHLSSVAVASYLWSDGTSASYDPASISGLYYLVVRDVHQCWDHTTYTGVTVLTRPDLSIRGRVSYCQGETVQLNCYRWPGYTYQWYRGATAIPGGNYMYDNGLGAGTYAYRLVATDTTSYHCAPDTSAPDTVIIHPLPSKPVISSVNPISCPQYKLQVNCSTLAGYHYNWSNGGYGSADTVMGGGALRVWCTDTFGCTNYTDTLIPYSPETWLAWFPSGCYNICQQAIRDSLNGPPGTFYSWQWLKNMASAGSGSNSLITPLGLTGTGTFYYQLGLANQYCINPVLSDTMQATMQNCSGSPCGSLQSANLTCNSSTPAGYNLTVNFLVAPAVGTLLKIGLSTGPVLPFTIPYTGGPLPTMHFTTLSVPPPSKALVEVTFTNPTTGQTCYDTISVNVPYPCGWAAEKQTQQEEPQPISKTEQATGLVVYPNPAGQQLNVNYIYGTDKDVDRRIVIYDMKGRLVENRQVKDMNGTMNIQTGNFATGMYILQMQENGKPLHTERVSIVH